MFGIPPLGGSPLLQWLFDDSKGESPRRFVYFIEETKAKNGLSFPFKSGSPGV
jgi:hypothetical protein